ncbi:MAG: hypothetical protein ACK4RZ_06765 [Paracoccaceae bacterium]
MTAPVTAPTNALRRHRALARMLALVYAVIIPTPKWKHFALPSGSILLCR